MTPKLSLSIPTPCHENWNTMTPQQQGRFCGQCNKTVVDFSLMTDGQILDLLKKQSGETCGRFTTDQLQRPLIAPLKPKWYSTGMWKYIISAALLGKAVESKAQQSADTTKKCTTNPRRPLMGKIIPKKPQAALQNKAQLEQKKPLTFAAPQSYTQIRIGQVRSTPINQELNYVVLDNNGQKYTGIKIAQDKDTFIAKNSFGQSALINGNDIKSIEIQKPNTLILALKNEINFDNKKLRYQIIDLQDSLPISKATVTVSIAGILTHYITDENGEIIILVTNTTNEATISISHVGYQTQTIKLAANLLEKAKQKETILLAQKHNKMEAVQVVAYEAMGRVIRCYTAGSVVKENIVETKTDTAISFITKLFTPKPNATVYPNPVAAGNNITISYTSKKEEFILIQLFTADGKWLKQEKMKVTKGENQSLFTIPQQIAAQQATIVITNSVGKKITTQNIIVHH